MSGRQEQRPDNEFLIGNYHVTLGARGRSVGTASGKADATVDEWERCEIAYRFVDPLIGSCPLLEGPVDEERLGRELCI